MGDRHSGIYAPILSWAVVVGLAGWALATFPLRGASLSAAPLWLLGAAMAASVIARWQGRNDVPRLSMTFVLAALLLVPSPAAVLLALAASTAGRGGGVAGLPTAGPRAMAASTLAVALVDAASRLPASLSQGPTTDLVRLLLGAYAVQVLALGFGVVLAGGRAFPSGNPRLWSRLASESASAPAAWVLVTLVRGEAQAAAAVLAALVLATQALLWRLVRDAERARVTSHGLRTREGELDTLHAMGREMLASHDVSRVGAIVARECRKLFPVDRVVLALGPDTDLGRPGTAFRIEGTGDEVDSRDPLVRWLVEEKRGFLLDETNADCPERRSTLLDEGSRSVVAVPLVVVDRVVALVVLQTASPDAYDVRSLDLLSIVSQQTALAIANARHYERATVDSLTGFFLRDHFFRRLQEEYRRVVRYGGTFSLLMIDLDGFKEINDRHGHLAGDEYLRGISRSVSHELRGADLPCRYGGDEFCVLLPETDLEGARVIAERIRAAIGRRIVGVEEVALRTTASIGLACYPDHDGSGAGTLLRRADEALYHAKRLGRDRVVPFAA